MPINGSCALIARSVAARYGNREVLSDVSLSIKAGECVALLGPNGSGKTTLLRVLAGLHRPARGDTQVVKDGPVAARDVLVWLVPQGAPMFWPLTIRENLASATYALRRDEERMAIDEIVRRIPEVRPLLKRRAVSLSGGERQLCSIAIGLLRNPQFLLLDEPSAGLAPGVVPILMQVIREEIERGAGIVIVEHRQPDVIALASRAYALGGGRVTYDGPVELAPTTLTSGV